MSHESGVRVCRVRRFFPIAPSPRAPLRVGGALPGGDLSASKVILQKPSPGTGTQSIFMWHVLRKAFGASRFMFYVSGLAEQVSCREVVVRVSCFVMI